MLLGLLVLVPLGAGTDSEQRGVTLAVVDVNGVPIFAGPSLNMNAYATVSRISLLEPARLSSFDRATDSGVVLGRS